MTYLNTFKVSNFYNKNQFLLEGPAETIFQSYDSTIAIIKKGCLTLGLNWDYSHTTLKHLYLFLNDFKGYLNADLYEEVYKALNATNKKQALEKLIKKGVIKYDKGIR